MGSALRTRRSRHGMSAFVGLDVHTEQTFATVLDPAGRVVAQQRMPNDWVPAFLERFHVERVGLEASNTRWSPWITPAATSRRATSSKTRGKTWRGPVVRAPAEGQWIRHPFPKAQAIPPLRMLGQELDEPSLGVRDAKIEEEPGKKQACRRVDRRSPRALWFHRLEDVAQLLLDDVDQILKQDNLSIHLPTIHIPRQAE
jgi:hypothetical protein